MINIWTYLSYIDYTYAFLDSLYYDEKLKRWVDPNADPNEDDGHNAKPPPTDMQLMGGAQMKKPVSTYNSSSSEIPAGPPLPLGGNKFSAGMFMLVLID